MGNSNKVVDRSGNFGMIPDVGKVIETKRHFSRKIGK
jgi:hypothetical protein